MKIFAFIFARGGSKGVVGKNLRLLAGKPLLAYSVEIAQQIEGVSRILVSTEDKKIAAVAMDLGAEVIPRPPELAQDDSPEWLAWRHALDWLESRGERFDIFLSLPTTSPLRSVGDVENCLTCLDEETDIVVTITDTTRNPWFNMVKREGSYVLPLLEEGGTYYRRQDVPPVYEMTTVAYVTRPEFIRKANGIFEGRVKAVHVPNERALDIDTEFDFLIAELLIQHRNAKQ